MRVPWTARRSNQSTLKEISPEYSLGGLVLKLKLQYFGHQMQRTDSLEKILMLEKTEGGKEKGTTEDEMAGWHHRLSGHEFEQSRGVGDAIQPSHLCHPLFLPSIFPSIRVFSNESVLCIWWPKDWSFSISPSSEYSGLISFRKEQHYGECL